MNIGVAGSAWADAYRIDRLRFRYGGDRKAAQTAGPHVFDGLTCEIRQGEVLGIVGPNGSGKSTLLKLLARVLRPQGGTIHLFDRDLSVPSQADIAKQVAFVPQDASVTFPFSVQDIVLMARFPHRRHGWLPGLGWERQEDYEIVRQAMEHLDVDGIAERAFSELSAGERQRVLIARALAQSASVMLLDEPSAFLDLHHQLEMCQTLSRLHRQGRLTIVLVSHDLNLASQYCERILLLDRGKVVGLGRPEEILRAPVLEPVYRCKVLVDRHADSGRPRVSLPREAPG